MARAEPEKSLYDVLDVRPDASTDDINAAYQRLCQLLEPDALATYAMMDEAQRASRGAELDAAYAILADPEQRRLYDRNLYGDSTPPHSSEPAAAGSGAASADGEGSARAAPAAAGSGAASADGEGAARATPAAGESGALSGDARAADAAANAARAEPTKRQAPAPPPETGPRQVGTPGPRRLQPSAEIELPDDGDFTGDVFRRLRESANASVEDVAEITKISKRYIKALEAEDFGTLPAPPYVRGFVAQYARVLGLEPEAVAKSYMSLYRRSQQRGSG